MGGKHAADHPGSLRVVIDHAEFARVQRLATFEITNAVLNINVALQRNFDLRPEAIQIYLLVAIASVQRYVRNPSDQDFFGTEPLPGHLAGTISRRRLSDVTGIPRETVARHIRHLMERGLVVDHGTGRLATPQGVLRDAAAVGLLDTLAAEVADVSGKLLRMGVLRIA